MRAKEFIIENEGTDVKSKIQKSFQQSSRGLHIFTNPSDRLYGLNRVMQAVACADGIEKPVIDGESWASTRNIAAPYTEVEAQMLKHAYETVGEKYNDVNNGNMNSQELKSTNTKSPIKAFKGYK